jgi:hypothetical protein
MNQPQKSAKFENESAPWVFTTENFSPPVPQPGSPASLSDSSRTARAFARRRNIIPIESPKIVEFGVFHMTVVQADVDAAGQ